jgi:VWFA-related protein
LRAASNALIDALFREDRAALLTFGDRVDERSSLSGDLVSLRAAIARAQAGGDTTLVDAAYSAIARGDTDAGRTLVVLFSDGIDTASWLAPARVLDALGQSDVVVYAVWAGSGKRPAFLHELADASGGRVIDATEARRLQETFLSVLNEFRHRYLITYSPKGVAPGGWHTLDVRVRRAGVTVRARPGYLASGVP